MLIVIQVVQVIWTKTSRGGQGANRRSAVPLAFLLPHPGQQPRQSAPSYTYHHLRCAEHDDFRPKPQKPTTGTLTDTLTLDRLSIHPPDSMGMVRVTYQPRRPAYLAYARDHTGTYRPGGHEALALQQGEWGQARYNWRHAGYDDTWYDQWDVNIGCFATFESAAFLEAPPTKVYSQLAPLW